MVPSSCNGVAWHETAGEVLGLKWPRSVAGGLTPSLGSDIHSMTLSLPASYSAQTPTSAVATDFRLRKQPNSLYLLGGSRESTAHRSA